MLLHPQRKGKPEPMHTAVCMGLTLLLAAFSSEGGQREPKRGSEALNT